MKNNWLLMCALATFGCGSGGGGHWSFPAADDGGSSNSDLATSRTDGGGARDMASLTSPDLRAPVDLTVPPDLTIPPDLSLPCLPGHYSGPIKASFVVGITFNVTGIADLSLDAPQNGRLNISQGTMSGSGGGATFKADLVGSVDCAAVDFPLSGMLQNGVATALGQTVNFTGTATANYDVQQRALINGTISVMSFNGKGTWSAR